MFVCLSATLLNFQETVLLGDQMSNGQMHKKEQRLSLVRLSIKSKQVYITVQSDPIFKTEQVKIKLWGWFTSPSGLKGR